ncbi:MAG TPA: type II toxin-antitoxin system prevent-host-death family antitoxin [Xanthobacteraceae bacterium]|jgi:prevent-host-death family protein|nr:type II toxin-antitoxin system prevent-host-death family antitoxin [Xanthobacteraceae bacterium]
MAAFSIHQAKTNLSKLIARAEAGEEVVIMRGKEPVARLTGMPNARPKPTFGMLKGKIKSPPDSFFFDPLPEEELRLYEGDVEDPLR